MTHSKLSAVADMLSETGDIHIVLTVDQARKLCEEHAETTKDLITATTKLTNSKTEIERLHRIISADRQAGAADRYAHRKYRELSEAFLLAYLEEREALAKYHATYSNEAWERAAKARQELAAVLTQLLEHTYVKAKVLS